MSGARVLFVEREGALLAAPPEGPPDRLERLRLKPGVIPALLDLARAGYRLVLVSPPPEPGTDPSPAGPAGVTEFLRDLLASQGVVFDGTLAWPHRPGDGAQAPAPPAGPAAGEPAARPLDPARSCVIGDGEPGLQLAADLGVAFVRVAADGAGGETWAEIAGRLCRPDRRARVERCTRETRIEVEVALDRSAPVSIATGIGFFDHMLEQVARHGGFALTLSCQGDLEVDEHHTVEDCALALGQALREALGDKRGIGRYGFLLAMDESQAQVAIDLSGRPYAVFEGRFGREAVGGLPTELVPHFFRSLADSLGAAIHVQVRGENSHHMVEACFKGVGRALRQALRVEGTELPSSKGVL